VAEVGLAGHDSREGKRLRVCNHLTKFLLSPLCHKMWGQALLKFSKSRGEFLRIIACANQIFLVNCLNELP